MRRATKKAVVVLSVLSGLCPSALALNPSLDLSQYGHNAWRIREGIFRGAPISITQTPDGYLWLGTELALVRFDGVRAAEWTPPGRESLPSNWIRRLITGRDGTLWIGTNAGLAGWNGSRISRYPELDGHAVLSLLEDHEGTIWVGTDGLPSGRLCALRGGTTQCYGEDGILGRGVLSLSEDAAGSLWAGAESGLWRWKPGSPHPYSLAHSSPVFEIRDLSSTAGGLLIATNDGMMRLEGGKGEPYPTPRSAPASIPTRMLWDRDGGLWIGTSGRGLLHVHQGRTDVFSRADGLSGDNIFSLFEDREGNIWVASSGGLDRFRESTVVTVSLKQGLTSDTVFSVLAARDGSVWAAGRNGLDRWKNGQVTTFRKRDGLPGDIAVSLFEDSGGRIWAFTLQGPAYFDSGRFVAVNGIPGGQVHAICAETAGDLWLSEDHGLLHFAAGHLADEIPWSRLGRLGNAMALAVDRLRGGVWLGFAKGGGVVYLKDGLVRQSYQGPQGLVAGMVSGLQLDQKGRLWAATDGGLSAVKDGRVVTLNSKNGLPCDTVLWRMEANDGSNWLYMPCGLVRIGPGELEAWSADPKRRIPIGAYEASDGVLSRASPGNYSPRVAKDTEGKIWFVGLEGVSVFDPAHLPVNKLLPPVHIESVIADDKTYDLKPGMRLPANVRNLRIEYTALSLVAPEKTHFKYRLDGQNRNWHEVINERQVQFTNLPPRNYRFQVIASNNSGVWNETGDTLEFSIAPAWNQTTWFYAACVAAFLAMLWGLYRLRLLQISREFNAQLEGRVDERLRVARELHDTLLQSFQGMMPFLQVARNKFAKGGDGLETLDQALGLGAQAIAEGREAIQGMRSSTTITNDLARAIQAVGDELKSEGSAEFRVLVEGSSRNLHPILRDEVYGIAREAIRNAFRHAEAKAIEVEIAYRDDLRVRIRDDGKGIDPEIAKEGRSGHYGIPGMHERAGRIGGKLTVWSAPGAGTEIELRVPGSKAFGKSSTRSLAALFRRGNGKGESAVAGDRHGE